MSTTDRDRDRQNIDGTPTNMRKRLPPIYAHQERESMRRKLEGRPLCTDCREPLTVADSKAKQTLCRLCRELRWG